MTTTITATLLIGSGSSRCSNCRRSTLPDATHHTDIPGPTPRPGAGCGALFTDMRGDYDIVTDSQLRRLRPDLPITHPTA